MRLGVGRGMTTVEELSVSPASDCNSNNVDASYASTTSDAEFIQDNCDYQWFPDCGYREVHHRSVLSSCYDYDEMARDLDSQLAQVDMEDYSAQDILSTLPAMCCTEVQSEHRGEMFASVSGSLMVKFEFDSSLSPHTSSQDESTMSLCQSEPLFSPVKEAPLFPTNYSVDSLDADDQDHLIVTCQANKTNYTIAFHGSTVMEDGSDFTDGESLTSLDVPKKSNNMAASDAATTTWSKLRRIPQHPRQRSKTISLPDLAPPSKLTTSLALGRCMKLYDIQNSGSATSESFSGSGGENRSSLNSHKQGNFSLLRMFIAQRSCMEQNQDKTKIQCKLIRNANEIGSMAETAWMEDMSACYEDSLVRDNSGEPESSSVERLSSKSVSICSCSMSASSNKFNVNNNNSFERQHKKHNVKVGTSGSELSEPTSSSEQTGHTKVVLNERKCPIHCVDRSMQTSSLQSNQAADAKDESQGKKPVYVLYPNYTLPDLGFLRKNSLDLDRILLAPIKFGSGSSPGTPPINSDPYRTVTKQDIDMLRQKGVSHILDWSSLTPLLPQEYWSILAELPQIRQHSATRFDSFRPHFCTTPTLSKELPTFADLKSTNVNSSGCSTGTAPSSGYRGSSTLLSESGSNPPNPLYVYNYGSDEKSKSKRKSTEVPENKRYSMFEFGSLEDVLDQGIDKKGKRKSFPNPTIPLKDPSEKEMWDDWWKDTRQRPNSPPSTHAQRLDQLIELSGHDQWQPHDINTLRDQVSKFLSEVGKKCLNFTHEGDQQLTPPNSPTCQKVYQGKQISLDLRPIIDNISENKKTLIDGIAEAVDKVVNYNEENVSQIVLDCLCPTLYALLSDGLKPQLDTPFGPINNTVWQVVEASAQQSPMTRGLHDLVVKINSEDVLSEGLIKFNAFVFGLLNVKGLDAWVSYARTRESVLSKHYTEESILLSASKGQAKSRALTDQLINALKPLSQCDFNLDLLFETRCLHESLLQLTRIPMSPSQNVDLSSDSILRRIVASLRSGGLGLHSSAEQSETSESTRSARPRSCVDAVAGGDMACTAKKRWSGVQVGSRLVNAYDRLQADEEFPDSLEPDVKSSSDEGTEREELEKDKDPKDRGGKFRSLQKKWEMLSGHTVGSSDLSPVKSVSSNQGVRSKIPRPVTSPVRPQSRLPTLIKEPRKIPGPSAAPRARTADARLSRPSRVDAPPDKVITSRPSSLPYRPPVSAPKVQRRAASSSTVRNTSRTTHQTSNRTVVTLTHRLPKDSGHLAFNEGERLRLVLEVDDTWLLCCRGDQKGLVPRSSVI
ncbi:hypothetical protein GE061_017000 [Apolygus lucorum]|uniref:SH3 domain-containing protein n=1 Tax=Apolygus lucorum TaxID=248454 RepID=A0A8S9XHS6_APOLU|nr:hypothetical protein GE061_017000 [Apolygus lucorum]